MLAFHALKLNLRWGNDTFIASLKRAIKVPSCLGSKTKRHLLFLSGKMEIGNTSPRCHKATPQSIPRLLPGNTPHWCSHFSHPSHQSGSEASRWTSAGSAQDEMKLGYFTLRGKIWQSSWVWVLVRDASGMLSYLFFKSWKTIHPGKPKESEKKINSFVFNWKRLDLHDALWNSFHVFQNHGRGHLVLLNRWENSLRTMRGLLSSRPFTRLAWRRKSWKGCH